jgi:hypothetical protein
MEITDCPEITDEMVAEMHECILATLERLSAFKEVLPTPYEFHRAVKNDGEGKGWSYHAIGFGEPDLKILAEILTAWNNRPARKEVEDSGDFDPVEAELQEIADGAWGGGDFKRGLAQKALDNHRAHKRAILSSDTGGDGWKPIETAPKDGTRVLVCRAGEAWNADAIWVEWAQEWRNADGATNTYPAVTHWRHQLKTPTSPDAKSNGSAEQ